MVEISDVPRLFPLGGGAFDNFTNYCYSKKKVTGNTVANSLANLTILGWLEPPRPHRHTLG